MGASSGTPERSDVPQEERLRSVGVESAKRLRRVHGLMFGTPIRKCPVCGSRSFGNVMADLGLWNQSYGEWICYRCFWWSVSIRLGRPH